MLSRVKHEKSLNLGALSGDLMVLEEMLLSNRQIVIQ